MSTKSLRDLCPPNPGEKLPYKNGQNNVTSDIANCIMEGDCFLIAVSRMYGGARLSDEAMTVYQKKSGKKLISERVEPDKITRTDPFLIETIRELGSKANGNVYGFVCTKWEIVLVEKKHYKSLVIDVNDGYESLLVDKE